MSKRFLKYRNLIQCEALTFEGYEYGHLLKCKQFLRSYYGFFSERQLVFYLQSCVKLGSRRTLVNGLIGFLESRLDVALFRSFLVCSIKEARYYISRGFVFVLKQISKTIISKNFVRVKHPSYLLMPGDLVWVNAKFSKNQLSNSAFDSFNGFSSHLEVDFGINMFSFLFRPTLYETYFPFLYSVEETVSLNVISNKSGVVFSWETLYDLECSSFNNNQIYNEDLTTNMFITNFFELVLLYYGKKKII